MPSSRDDEFAKAFAPLMEVRQGGTFRPATPNDVLEILGSGGKRYVLRAENGRIKGQYVSANDAGWSFHQKEALVVPELEVARQAREEGDAHGVKVKILRIRRKGTCGLEAVRLRPDISIGVDGELVTMDISKEEGMRLMAALTGAKSSSQEQ